MLVDLGDMQVESVVFSFHRKGQLGQFFLLDFGVWIVI